MTEGMDVYIWLIHVVQQKLTQHCEAIILQWDKRKKDHQGSWSLVIVAVEGSLASAHCQTRDWPLSLYHSLSLPHLTLLIRENLLSVIHQGQHVPLQFSEFLKV